MRLMIENVFKNGFRTGDTGIIDGKENGIQQTCILSDEEHSVAGVEVDLQGAFQAHTY